MTVRTSIDAIHVDAMNTPTFRIQSLDSGAYAAPMPTLLPFVPCEHCAAVYALPDAIKRAEELAALTGQQCRLVASELEWHLKQSVDFLPH